MKKSLLFIGFVFLSILSLSFVSAAESNFANSFAKVVGGIGDGLKGGIEALKPVLKYLLGDVETSIEGFTTDQLFFGKLLIFILLMAVVWAVVRRIPLFRDHDWVIWLIAIVLPLLALRFFTPEMVLASAWPSSAFAVALTAFLPLIFWFYFVEYSGVSRVLRKIAWVFAACIFLGVYFIRFDELGSFALMYLVAAIASLAFLFFDGTIQNYRRKIAQEKQFTAANYVRYNKILKEREEVAEALTEARKRGDMIASGALQTRLDNLDSTIDHLLKNPT